MIRAAAPVWVFGLLLTALLGGCSAMPPVPEAPAAIDTRWEDLDEVLQTNAVVATASPERHNISFVSSPLGVNEFTGVRGGAGSATNQLSKRLVELSETLGIEVLDRSRINEIVSELKLTESDWTNLSEEEQFKRIGVYARVDYLLVGNVAHDDTQQMNVILRKVPLEGEVERYEREYEEFIEACSVAQVELDDIVTKETLVASYTGRVDQARGRQGRIDAVMSATPDPATALSDIEDLQRQKFSSVSSFGIDARLIHVNTGKAIWFYQGEAKGTSRNDTLNSVVNDLVVKLLQLEE